MSWVQPKFCDYVIQPAKKQKTKHTSNKPIKNFNETPEEICLLNKWKPKKKSDLVVHKKKLEEIEIFLDEIKQKNGTFYLLLYGPPGSGKLTTLKVLCNEFSINLIEWLPQITLSSFNPEISSIVPYQSEVSIFEDFVLRATRYSNVLNRNSCRLIVVKDIPLQYVKDSNLFHNFLLKYSDLNNVKLAFVVTDYKITRELFSEDVKKKFNIKTIQFNPITQRNTLNALQKIAKGNYIKYLDSISVSSAGDLRKAITTLQFLAVKGGLPEKSNEEQSNDDAVDIFHAIGRVLYAKRENGKFKHCPISLAETFISTPDLFVNLLHENYVGTFSSIHEISRASVCLTESDILLKPIESNTFCTIALSLTAYSLMSYNSNPVKKFQQFNRPTRICNNLTEFRSLSKDSESLIDIVSYGRFIPTFANTHKEMYKKLHPFGTTYNTYRQ